MGWFRKSFNRIKRSEVVEALIQLENQQTELLANIEDNNREIDELFGKGKATKDAQMRTIYANRIVSLKALNAQVGKRLSFVGANVNAMYSLKNAMDDKEFLENNSKITLNDMLARPDELNKFLMKVNSKKMSHEQALTQTMDVFEQVEAGYVGDERIYGIGEEQQHILDMFEATDEDITADFTETEQAEESAETMGVKAN